MNKLNEKQLAVLGIAFNTPLPMISIDDMFDNPKVDDWVTQGSPFVWIAATVHKDYTLYHDVGYGNMALFKDGEFVGAGKHEVYTDKVVALDGSYYGLPDDHPCIYVYEG